MTSDSEDFESADEGSEDDVDKNKSQTKKLGLDRIIDSKVVDKSSKLARSALNDNMNPPKVNQGAGNIDEVDPKCRDSKGNGAWDDFDIEEDPSEHRIARAEVPSASIVSDPNSACKSDAPAKSDGWDEFDDWEACDPMDTKANASPTSDSTMDQTQLRSVVDRLSAIGDKQGSSDGGWGWGGWVNSITNHVSHGISTVTNALESGIGAPDPEEMARKLKEDRQKREKSPMEGANTVSVSNDTESHIDVSEQGDNVFGFGQLMSSVSQISKLVESTGTKVIHGGLDTLENIGKKTMQVLQDGDPGLAKKRALLGLDRSQKPVLSQILREAKEMADEEDKLITLKKQAREVRYEILFDDYAGLVHLEALEMLSKQSDMKIQSLLLSTEGEPLEELKETLSQVKELCELPDDDEDEEEDLLKGDADSISETLRSKLTEASQDIGTKINFDPIVRLWHENVEWILPQIDGPVSSAPREVLKQAISCLAHTTALSVEVYHKTAELMLVKSRRSTADEADSLTQLTTILTRHISGIATVFTQLLGKMASDVEKAEEINSLITNIFLEAGNSSTYIQDAFHLTLPILQCGAT